MIFRYHMSPHKKHTRNHQICQKPIFQKLHIKITLNKAEIKKFQEIIKKLLKIHAEIKIS